MVLLFCPAALADYGEIPAYKQLLMRGGLDVFTTAENFDSTNSIVPLPSGVELVDTNFNLSAEYGAANGWAAGLSFKFVNSEVGTANSLVLSNAGIGDIVAHVKWAIKAASPYMTIEARTKFPAASGNVKSNDEVVLGDGNFDFHLLLHTGAKSNRFFFTLSPGLLVRFGGYSTAATVDGAIEFRLPRGFVRGYGSFIYSFEDPQLFDSSPTTHDAAGSGGSFARLTGGPIGFYAGGKLGIRVYRTWWMEALFEMSVFGNKYPVFSRWGLNLVALFDFYDEPKKKRIREIPFDIDYDKFDRPE